MKGTLITLAVFGLFAVGCDQIEPTTPVGDGFGVTPQANMAGIAHRASVGGADSELYPPGTDANFSLVAIEWVDGRESGQWQDAFGSNGGIHVAVDCLSVSGNEAWVSGVITKGNLGDIDLAGLPAITRIADNGTSADDPADQISYSWISPTQFPPYYSDDCKDQPDLPLFNTNNGQVKVW